MLLSAASKRRYFSFSQQRHGGPARSASILRAFGDVLEGLRPSRPRAIGQTETISVRPSAITWS